MLAYKTAMDLTTQTINRRAKYFRNLIVTVVLVSLGSICWAVLARAIAPLSGLLLLFPICGSYFFIDGSLLNNWRSQLLAIWTKGEIDFLAFRSAAGAIPNLPRDTLQGMLATLPEAGDLVTEQGVSATTREATAAIVTTIHACRSDAVALKAIAYALTGSLFIVALALRAWQPLLGLVAIISIPFLRQALRRWRLTYTMVRTSLAQQQPDFNIHQCVELMTRLDWDPISASEKDKFLPSYVREDVRFETQAQGRDDLPEKVLEAADR